MIGLSRSYRKGIARAAIATLLAFASASVTSCNIGAGCNGTNCDGSLTVVFDPDLDLWVERYDGGIYDGIYDGGISNSGAPSDSIEIAIEEATQTKPTFAPLQTCWMIPEARQQVLCDQGSKGLNATTTLNFSTDIRQLRVTMSKNGTQLSQQTITPTYTTRPCACGGMTVSNGTVSITLPSP